MERNECVLSEADIKSMNRGKANSKSFNPLNWKARRNKRLKDAGLEYKIVKGNRKGQVIPAKEPPNGERVCKCSKTGCQLPKDDLHDLFKSYYEMDSKAQNRFLADSIDVSSPVRRTVDAEKSRRSYTYIYWIKFCGRRHQVCERMFLQLFKLTEGKLRTIREKLKQGKFCFDDGRGKTKGVHSKLITDELREQIKVHIDSFPKHESHYSREKVDAEKRFLEPGLSVSRMHVMFNNQMSAEGKPECSLGTYRDVFKKLNLSIGNPVSDSCGYCDELRSRINRETSVLAKTELIKDRDKHLLIAETARKMNQNDKNDPENAKFSITTDMEKVLFVPQLTCGEHFFKRTLSTFNLGIHETGTSNGFMYVWDETISEHSSKDVISCIWKYIMQTFNVLAENENRELIIWSDRCVGQYNNSYFVLFLKYLVDQSYFTQVDHKFFSTGHSYMSCDCDFGHIERRFRQVLPIVPTDVDEVIKTARIANPFRLTRMTNADFTNFNILAENASLQSSLKVTQYLWYRYSKYQPNQIFVKSTHSDENWITFKILNRKNTKVEAPLFKCIVLPQSHIEPIQLKKEKAQDLRSLMKKIIDPDKYTYYDNLTKFVAQKS